VVKNGDEEEVGKKEGWKEGGREGGSNRPGFDNNNLTTTIHHLIDEE